MATTKTRKSATAAKRLAAQAKVAELHAQLTAGVEAVTETDSWAEWLAFGAKFHDYSFGNVMLIGMQRPDATHVAGYRAWQAMGRQVRKGETGISILAPRTGPCRDCRGEGCARCDGSGRYLFFTTATVFDVSQTDGDALPEPPARRLEGEDNAALFGRVQDVLLPEGWTVKVEAVPGEANGYCRHTSKLVVVDEGLSPAMKVKTLVHELAHANLHGEGTDYAAERGRCEVEAESVAFVVLGALGVATDDYSFGYVAGWSGGDVAKVEATGRAVMKLANRMLSDLDPQAAEVAA